MHPGNILITLDGESEQCDRVIDTGIKTLDLGNRSNWFEEMISFDKREENKYRPKAAIISWSPEYLLNHGEIIGMEQDIYSIGIMFFIC